MSLLTLLISGSRVNMDHPREVYINSYDTESQIWCKLDSHIWQAVITIQKYKRTSTRQESDHFIATKCIDPELDWITRQFIGGREWAPLTQEGKMLIRLCWISSSIPRQQYYQEVGGQLATQPNKMPHKIQTWRVNTSIKYKFFTTCWCRKTCKAI